jgi:hypothetical protein
MRMQRSLGVTIGIVVAAVTLMAPSALATQPGVSPVSQTVTQPYHCTTPLGDADLSATVTGKAVIKGSKISLKAVKYSVTNSVGLSLTIDHVMVWTPDPGKKAAKYVDGSVKVGKKPAGWKAGHDSSGVFASFPGSQTVANGDDITTAPLSAKYKAKGASGTVVDFVAGDVTLHVSSPLSGTVSCTPDPAETFASVTE